MALSLMSQESSAEESDAPTEMFPEGSIRLSEISIYNWGTFNGLHTGAIDPGGTLISGHTGAGKSTFADALQPLLLRPMDAQFNTAASRSQGKDRSLLSYIRGRLGDGEDSNGRSTGVYKRPRNTLSGLRALYRTDRGNAITIAALFWVTGEGTSMADVHRGYVVAYRDLPLKELLDALKGKDRAAVRWDNVSGQYKGRGDVHCTTSFDAYEALYSEALWLGDNKAPALLVRAMGIKQIDDLTSLVRDMVLEEPETRDLATKAIAEFRSLQDIHAELTLARRRREGLKLLPEEASKRVAALAGRDEAQKLHNVMPAWHSRQVVDLYRGVIEERQTELRILEQQVEDQKAHIATLQDQHSTADQIYRAAGGDDLEALEGRARRARSAIDEAAGNLKALEKMVGALKINVPDSGWTDASLADLKALIQRRIDGGAAEVEALRQKEAHLGVEEIEVRRQIKELREDILELQTQPSSNIDPGYLRLRRELCTELQIKIEDVPFVGEMIDVKESETEWRGAIERALGFARLRMVVDSSLGPRVRSYINSRHLGRRVGVEVAAAVSGIAAFRERSFLRKLEFNNGRHREWVKHYLLDHQLECVDHPEEMQGRPYCMTRQGLIQRKPGSLEKDDTDDINNRKKWYLGFSNEPRRSQLAQDLALAAARDADIQRQLLEVRAQRGLQDSFATSGQQVLQFDWASIDVQGAVHIHREIEAAIQRMRDKQVDLESARQRLAQCKEDLGTANTKLGEMNQKVGTERTKISHYRDEVARHSPRVVSILDANLLDKLNEKLGRLTRENLAKEIDVEARHASQLNRELEASRNLVGGVERQIDLIISAYKAVFPGEAADLPLRSREMTTEATTRLVDEWLAHLRELEEGKLPDLVERFTSLLNRHSQQSLTSIYHAVQSQQEQIGDRIDQINTVLEKTEIKNGTHLSLVATKLVEEGARLFDEQMRLTMSRAAGSDPEAHFMALQDLVKMLERATDASTRNNKEVRCQLDARYRMEFAIREWRPMQGHGPLCGPEHRETVYMHRNTKGKSGGEKEGFSGLVVASALAYVLTPRGASRPSYCSVILDEAFSNTSDDLAARVLKVFKELGLHLNLITPFKNVELARRAVKSALVVEKDAQNESHLCEVTWEEINQQRLEAEREDERLREAADRLKVSFEEA